MPLTLKKLTPALWPAVEALFGANGACGGCWCMHWRTEKGEAWQDIKGATAKARFRKLVESGKAKGVLAFDGDTPVGWCSYGPRVEFAKLDRAPSLRCDDAERVWSLPCFFIKAGYRNQGIAGKLLAFAMQCLKEEGATIAEAYPVKPRPGQKMPGAFAWTGVVSMFRTAGFQPADKKPTGKQRMRKAL